MGERARITTVRLPIRLIEQLDAAAHDQMTNRTAVIIRASLEWLRAERAEEKQREEGPTQTT